MNLNLYRKFLQHLLKAKRRHGTHSPFVYGYADQVLNDKNVVILPQAKSQQFTALIKKTLQYINPKEIENHSNLAIQFQYNSKAISFSEKLIIDTIDNVHSISDNLQDYIFILNNESKIQRQKWNDFIHSNTFSLTMDVWNIRIYYPINNSKSNSIFY